MVQLFSNQIDNAVLPPSWASGIISVTTVPKVQRRLHSNNNVFFAVWFLKLSAWNLLHFKVDVIQDTIFIMTCTADVRPVTWIPPKTLFSLLTWWWWYFFVTSIIAFILYRIKSVQGSSLFCNVLHLSGRVHGCELCELHTIFVCMEPSSNMNI